MAAVEVLLPGALFTGIGIAMYCIMRSGIKVIHIRNRRGMSDASSITADSLDEDEVGFSDEDDETDMECPQRRGQRDRGMHANEDEDAYSI